MSKRRDARLEFMGALNKFVNAWFDLSGRWNDLDSDDQDLPTDQYPFHESFDDLASRVLTWKEVTVEKMEEPIKYVKLPKEAYEKFLAQVTEMEENIASEFNQEKGDFESVLERLPKPEIVEE